MSWSENVGKISKCPRRQNSFRWELPNFFAYYRDPSKNSYQEPISIISSPYFRYFDNDWRLVLIHNGRLYGKDHIGLFLWKSPSFNLSSFFAIRLGLTNSFGDFLPPFLDGETDNAGCFGSWEYLKEHDLMYKKEIICPTGILRFSCEILKKMPSVDAVPQGTLAESEKAENRAPEETAKEENSEAKGVDRLVLNLKNLLLSGQNSDVVLKVEDREFNVHRGIIVVRSPVFAPMLQHATKENATGVVDIPDCSAEAFEMFLTYIYTGSVDAISSGKVCDLYYIADKYQVHDLKSECVEFMENNLSVENFCKMMTLSFQHSEAGLQEAATRFFCENVKIIIKTAQWQKFMIDYTEQANELYMKAINA